MKRKNGFTLIELLAVIVVLAIIALIATPIVMNTIKNSKKGAAERTADNYTEQVETSLMTYRLENGENLPDGEYTIDSETGNLVGQGKTLTIEMSGTKPSSGTIVIENGGVKKEKTRMKVGDYDISYDTTNKTFVASESTGNNVEVLCKAKEEVTNGNKAEGNFNYGDEYSCELGDGEEKTFYIIENNTDTVSLIMNKEIGYADWCNKEDYLAAGGEDLSNDGGFCQNGGYCSTNEYGPITALNYLKNNTKSWRKLEENQISLPSAEQIAQAVGKTFNNNYISELPTWLVNSTYFTSTPDNSLHAVWVVYKSTGLDNAWFTGGGNGGIRPVITISKSQLG